MKKMMLVASLVIGCSCMAATCNPNVNPMPIPIDAGTSDVTPGSCNASLSHLIAIGCNPSGPWLEACNINRPHGMFALDCINQAATRSEVISNCKVDCN
jgi:hypothetical protein